MIRDYFLTKNQVASLFSDGPLNSLASRLVFAFGLVAMASFMAIGAFGVVNYSSNQIAMFTAVDMLIMVVCPFLLKKKKE